MNLRKAALLASVAAAAALFFMLDLGSYLTLENLKQQQAALEAWRVASPRLSIVVFFAVYVVVTALSLPGATVMTLAIGAIFVLKRSV